MGSTVDLDYIKNSKDPIGQYLLRAKHSWDTSKGYYAVDLGSPYSSKGYPIVVVLNFGGSSQNETVIKALRSNAHQVSILKDPKIPAGVVIVTDLELEPLREVEE